MKEGGLYSGVSSLGGRALLSPAGPRPAGSAAQQGRTDHQAANVKDTTRPLSAWAEQGRGEVRALRRTNERYSAGRTRGCWRPLGARRLSELVLRAGTPAPGMATRALSTDGLLRLPSLLASGWAVREGEEGERTGGKCQGRKWEPGDGTTLPGFRARHSQHCCVRGHCLLATDCVVSSRSGVRAAHIAVTAPGRAGPHATARAGPELGTG